MNKTFWVMYVCIWCFFSPGQQKVLTTYSKYLFSVQESEQNVTLKLWKGTYNILFNFLHGGLELNLRNTILIILKYSLKN